MRAVPNGKWLTKEETANNKGRNEIRDEHTTQNSQRSKSMSQSIKSDTQY